MFDRQLSSNPEIRSSGTVMKLDRLGASFQTRLSFMRRLIRHMHSEHWAISRTKFDLDKEGYGTAIYQVKTPNNYYSLVCFSHYLNPKERTDRVIAQNWDSTYTLFDGIPTERDIVRLAEQTVKQESGRFNATDLVLSRANKSLRLFENIVDKLAKGSQPDPYVLNSVGYLMRTTAVYANGKFGLADRSDYASRPELLPPYQLEMLTVYLIREFSLDLVDYLAACKAPNQAVKLDPILKRHLGMGNATGLGMAPFLVDHPILIHKWFEAREIALSRVLAVRKATPEKTNRFKMLLKRATQHLTEWNIEDYDQKQRISTMHSDMLSISQLISDSGGLESLLFPWNILLKKSEKILSIEGYELLVSLLMEPYPELVDELGEALHVEEKNSFDPGMKVATLLSTLNKHYDWALAIDFQDPDESEYFWYYSEEKLEPRRGRRTDETGVKNEMKISIARDIQDLHSALTKAEQHISLTYFLMSHPELRHITKRTQLAIHYPYSEIRGNMISNKCRPIDILRSKLAYFGASKFDPKSDLWTRITLAQGAPLRNELNIEDADDWCFPIVPKLF